MQAFHAAPGNATAIQTPATPLPPLPMELPRLVMRRALAVALGALLLCLVLGLLRMREDTRREMEGSLALARAGITLATIATQDSAAALAALRSLPGLRHMRLSVRDAQGRPLLEPVGEAVAPHTGVWLKLAALLDLAAPAPAVAWPVPRPDGPPWTVELIASPDSELHEALTNLASTLALLGLCCALMLAVMQWNVRRAFQPLQALLSAISRVEQQDMDGVRALKPMPTRELEAIAQALKHLVAEQEKAEDARRLLGLRLLSLREDERQRLARDLHDEFGQRLTALRVDAAWLTRRLHEQPALQGVAAGMADQVAQVQDDVRKLLARLRPFDIAGAGSAEPTLGRLRQMLQELVAGWSAAAHGQGPRIELAIGTADDALALPQDMVLGLYRMSQEALTNVARHAGADHVRLALRVDGEAGQALSLEWSVQDNGSGLDNLEAAMRRGSGLAGIKERVWALGGEFDWGPAGTQGAARGLRLRARFAVQPRPQDEEQP